MRVLRSERDYISWMFEDYFRFSDAPISPLMSDEEIQQALVELHPDSFPCIGYLTSSSSGCIYEVNYISPDTVSAWATELNVR
jgi:hypothetical protein